MATIGFDDENVFLIGTGYSTTRQGMQAFRRPVMGRVPRGEVKLVSGIFAYDSSYPTGGEDISEIWKQFTQFSSTTWGLLGFIIDRSGTISNSKTGKYPVIDYTNKKAMVYTNAATPVEAANTSDQSGSTFRFLAWGY